MIIGTMRLSATATGAKMMPIQVINSNCNGPSASPRSVRSTTDTTTVDNTPSARRRQ